MLGGNHEGAVKDLLVIDSLRGNHSVGLASVNNQGVVRLAKHAMLPQVFLSQKDVQDLFLGINRVMIGHNRFATQGAINSDNAHPYAFEHIVGAHNGTLRNQKLLPDHDKFEVDSQVLLNAIDKQGTDKVDDKISGAFALTWYDKRDNTLHMWRNTERPLFYCFTEDRKVMFWASEEAMLNLALSRKQIKFTKPVALPVNKEYIFSIDLGFNKEMEEPVVLDRKSYTAPVYTGNYGNYGRYSQGYYDGDGWYSGRRGSRDSWDNDYEDNYAGWNKKELPGVIKESIDAKKQLPLLTGPKSEGEGRRKEELLLISNQARVLGLRLKRLAALLLAESLSTTPK